MDEKKDQESKFDAFMNKVPSAESPGKFLKIVVVGSGVVLLILGVMFFIAFK